MGDAAAHSVAFDRGGAIAVATRLPIGLERRGGWGDTAIVTSTRSWTDVISGRRVEGGTVSLATLLDRYPVALLVADEVSS